MAEAPGIRSGALTPEAAAHLDLVVSRHDLSQALTRQVDFLVRQMHQTPDEAAAWIRQRTGIQPEDQESEHIAWFELGHLMETDPARGEQLWQRIKAEA